MGPAAKNLLQEGLLWGAVALGGFALFYFFDDLRAATKLATGKDI